MNNWRPPAYITSDDYGRPVVTTCSRCGAYVGSESVHSAWHQRIDPAQVVPAMTGGLTPAKLVQHDDAPEWTI